MDRLLYIIGRIFKADESEGFLLFWAKELLVALLIFGLFWIVSQFMVKALNKWGRRFTAFTKTDLDDRVLQRVIPYMSRLFIVLGVYLAIRSLPLHEKLLITASGVIYIVLVVIICNLVYHAIDELMKWYAASQEDTANVAMSRQMVPIAEKIVSLMIMGTALIIVLKHFDVDIFSLVTALGIGSLAIGMAAKDTLAHMISGFTIMLDRPFRIGDRILLVGGQIGDVVDIGLRSTKIKTFDNQLLIIPNSDLCNTMLTNQAFPNSRAKGRVNIGVAYGSDVDEVKSILVATALEVADVLKDPPPEAYFISFGDSALNMSLFYWVEEYGNLFATNDKVNSLIINRFREQKIEIPFPIRTVIMESADK
ncbi:MAG: mechanosensitive ion channel family protein [Desulfuromonadaceae bacterium]|nr:mechanosensitive ion channel family protein [Desulfuromonadaceae bacterium]